MFKRKIEKYLNEWKSDEHKMPLIIKGCRQCGKTFSVLDFAHKNYEHVVYIDFFQHPEYKSVFDGGLNIDLLCMTLSTLIPDANSYRARPVSSLTRYRNAHGPAQP